MLSTNSSHPGREVTGYEKSLSNPAGEFSHLQYQFAELCRDAKVQDETPKPGLFGFAETMFSVAGTFLKEHHLPLAGLRPFGSDEPRPSGLFADMGLVSQAVRLLPSDMLWHCTYQQDKRMAKTYVRKLHRLAEELLRFLWRAFTSLYPGISFHRQFYYIEFAVTLLYEWEKYEGHEDDDFMWTWCEFAYSQMPPLSSAMRRYEDALDPLYAISPDAAAKEIKSHADFVFTTPQDDRFATSEEILSAQRFSPDYALKYAELSAVAAQFVCLQYCREMDSTSAVERFFVPDAELRRFLLCFHEAFCHLKPSAAKSSPVLANVYPTVLRLFDAPPLRTASQPVAAAVQLARSYCDSYFQFVAYTQAGERPFLGEPATRILNRLFSAFTELSLQISSARSGQAPGALGVSALGTTWERFKSLEDPPPESPRDDKDEERRKTTPVMPSHETAFSQSDLKMLSEILSLGRKNRESLLEIKRDVKYIKSEQDGPSPVDSKRYGPAPKYPDMRDEAISLLKKWRTERMRSSDFSDPKPAKAAYNIFEKWNKDKTKKGKRYENLKSFQGIVARHWKRHT